MQSGGLTEMELNIGGHVIYAGSKVNVQWRGVWYDGMVIKIGPKRNLCRVHDLMIKQAILMEPNQLKFMETHALKRNFTPGTHVAYNDGDNWMEGMVEKENAVGAALVRWRKTVHAAETESWFELVDIAPVIPNEAYLKQEDDALRASRSGLLQNNMIEPHPRTVQNMLYESDVESDGSTHGSPHRTKTPRSQWQNNYPDHVEFEAPKHFTIHASPTYESIMSPEPLDSPVKQSPQHRPLPSPPPHSPYAGMLQPPMAFPHIVPYRYDWSRHRQFSPSHHPKPPVRRNLQSSSIPCALTYKTQYRNGIPPHHSSNFFKRFKRQGRRHSTSASHAGANYPRSGMKQSPSVISKAQSEPVPFAFQPMGLNIIPPRDVGKSNAKRQLFKDGKWGWKRKSSKKKEALMPSPYEVPVGRATNRSKIELSSLADTLEERSPSHGDLSGDTGVLDTSHKQQDAPPTVASASPSKLNVNTGGHLLLTCVAKSVKPATYEWKKDGKDIPMKANNITIPSPGMLELNKATLEDAGEYTCTISSENGSITRSFEVYVAEDFFSVFSNSPAKQDTGLQTSFSSRVTHDELNLKPEEPPADLTVQEFLNEIVEDIHISEVDLDNGGDLELDQAGYEVRKPADGKESSDIDSDINEKAEQNDTVHDLPTILVNSEHVPEKQVRRRHSVMRNDMEQYLEGYGEDYGALSSTTDLELEGLKHYKAKEIAKKTKDKEEKEKSKTKSKSKRFLRFPKFHKSSKVTTQTQNHSRSTEHIERDLAVESNVHPVETESNTGKEKEDDDENSVAVNTSLGSTESLVSGVEEDEGHVSLPLEIESISDQVRRLQQSLQEYDDTLLSDDQGSNKKGVFSSIFSSKVK